MIWITNSLIDDVSAGDYRVLFELLLWYFESVFVRNDILLHYYIVPALFYATDAYLKCEYLFIFENLYKASSVVTEASFRNLCY